MAAVEAGTGLMDTSQVRKYSEVRKGYTRFSEGDVLFAKITPCMENGKIAIAKGLTNGSGCGSTEFHVVRAPDALSNEYLAYFLLREEFRKEARRNMAGTAGQLRVPPGFLSDAIFPLPPLPEQRRIVAEIEKQFTRLDASVAALRRTQTNLKRYRGQRPADRLLRRAGAYRGGTGPRRGSGVRAGRCPSGAYPGGAPCSLGVPGETPGQVQGAGRARHIRPDAAAGGLGVGYEFRSTIDYRHAIDRSDI